MATTRVAYLFVAIILTSFLFTAPARAQTVMTLGQLECDASGSAGFLIFKTNTTLSCTFKGNKGEKDDRYSGQIAVAFEVGAVGGTRQEWSVEGAQQSVPHGALAGTYGGQGGDLTVAAGLGGYVLQGGGDKSYWLKSLSVGNRTGLHASLGFATLTLNQESKQ